MFVGVRARKSIKIGPGLRLTATNRGASLRVGGRGAGYSVSTSGRRTASVGIPGTGLSYQQQRGGGGARSAPVAPPKPGMFAPAYEKAFHKAIETYAAGDAERALALFRDAAAKDTAGKAVADDLFVGLLSAQLKDDATAIEYLEKVIDSEIALPDELMAKYVPGGGMQMGITEHITVEVPFGSLAALLTLVEVYQRAGRLDEAIGLLQQFVEFAPEPFIVLSLCDVYAEADAWDEIVDVAAGTANEDDVTLQIRLFYARALVKQGMSDAALEVFKDALRSSKRDADLLRETRYERAKLYLDLGKKAQGRKDLERVYADEPSYRDVRELLGAPAATTTSPPAAWHPDPEGKHELRYWDGARWTEHVSDRGVQSVDPTANDAAIR